MVCAFYFYSDLEPATENTTQVVDHFFRHESGRIVSHLSHRFGTENLSLAEDCVQEAMIKAMQIWPFKGVPDNPSAWMLTVSRNRMIDVLRRASRTDWEAKLPEFSENNSKYDWDEILKDDQLKMIFICCNPRISQEYQIILTLKILCGFGIKEIARGLLKSEAAIAKAYSRAKAKLQENREEFNLLTSQDLKKRLSVVLKVLYLMFNEGYGSSSEDQLIRKDLCLESMRLGKLLFEHELVEDTRVEALLALMCYQAARFNSRIDDEGMVVTLENQDRKEWDHELIDKGNFFLERSNDRTISEYHIQASIAASHANVKSYKDTNWNGILSLYNLYLNFSYSSIAALNRIVAFEKVHGAEKALAELEKLRKDLEDYYLFHAIHADLLIKTQQSKEASEALKKALSLTSNLAEKKHLQKKLENIKNV